MIIFALVLVRYKSTAYTGSTGMIELTPDQVDSIVVDMQIRPCKSKRIFLRSKMPEGSISKPLKKQMKSIRKSNQVLN